MVVGFAVVVVGFAVVVVGFAVEVVGFAVVTIDSFGVPPIALYWNFTLYPAASYLGSLAVVTNALPPVDDVITVV